MSHETVCASMGHRPYAQDEGGGWWCMCGQQAILNPGPCSTCGHTVKQHGGSEECIFRDCQGWTGPGAVVASARGRAFSQHLQRHREPVADCDWCPVTPASHRVQPDERAAREQPWAEFFYDEAREELERAGMYYGPSVLRHIYARQIRAAMALADAEVAAAVSGCRTRIDALADQYSQTADVAAPELEIVYRYFVGELLTLSAALAGEVNPE